MEMHQVRYFLVRLKSATFRNRHCRVRFSSWKESLAVLFSTVNGILRILPTSVRWFDPIWKLSLRRPSR